MTDPAKLALVNRLLARYRRSVWDITEDPDGDTPSLLLTNLRRRPVIEPRVQVVAIVRAVMGQVLVLEGSTYRPCAVPPLSRATLRKVLRHEIRRAERYHAPKVPPDPDEKRMRRIHATFTRRRAVVEQEKANAQYLAMRHAAITPALPAVVLGAGRDDVPVDETIDGARARLQALFEGVHAEYPKMNEEILKQYAATVRSRLAEFAEEPENHVLRDGVLKLLARICFEWDPVRHAIEIAEHERPVEQPTRMMQWVE